MIGGDGVAGAGHRREGRDHGARRVLGRQESQGHLGDHPEGAFAADEQFRQAQSRNIFQARAAQAHRGAVGQHHLQAQHVIGGDAVLDAAQAAGVGGDVAADAADLERRRVGRVPQPVLGDGLLDLGIEQARLDDRGAGHRVDGDVAHLLRRQHDAAVDGGGPARQPGAHSARHHGDPVGGGPPQNRLHLLGALRADHGHRRAGVGIGGTVLAIGLQNVGIGDDGAFGEFGSQAVDH